MADASRKCSVKITKGTQILKEFAPELECRQGDNLRKYPEVMKKLQIDVNVALTELVTEQQSAGKEDESNDAEKRKSINSKEKSSAIKKTKI